MSDVLDDLLRPLSEEELIKAQIDFEILWALSELTPEPAYRAPCNGVRFPSGGFWDPKPGPPMRY